MASSLNLALKDLAPWSPDIDPRRVEKPQIIAGANFIDDIDGPRSAFASSLSNWNFWDAATRGKITSLHIAGGTLYGTQTGVWKINPITGLAEILLAIPTVKEFWPWTIALVGTLYYIAQYNIGLWQYDPVAETLAKIDTPVGDNVSYVAASYGRLIFLGPTVVGISALDDGTDLTPDLATAAGAQPLSMVGGTAYRIEPIPDGFLVYQSEGIMKGTFTQQAYVFAYTKMTEAIKIFSPNAGVYIPRVGALSLDNSGFNLTREFNYTDLGIPQPWEIVMGDYVKKNIFATLDENLIGTVSMYYSTTSQLLFINFSSSTLEGVMSTGFVYSVINKKWGSFDHQNTGVFEIFDPGTNTYSTGYIGLDGFMREFEETDFSEDLPPSPYGIIDYLYRPLQTDELVRTTDIGGVFVQEVFTSINGSDNNPNAYASLTASGLYEINFTPYSDTVDDWGDDPEAIIGPVISVFTDISIYISGAVEIFAIPYTIPQIGIASFLQVGPCRFSDQVKALETSSIETVMIGASAVAGFIETEDWLLDAPSEDWLSDEGMEDWGSGTANPSNYDLVLRDTNDAFNMMVQGDEDLYTFIDLGAAKVFKPIGYSAIWHTFTLNCTEPGQSFAVKTLDIEGFLTGLLQTS